MNSERRWSPCLARESATKFALRLLWQISMFRFFILAFLIKFRWKVKFQGPPHSLLHHRTAFVESDSRMNMQFWTLWFDNEILIARWIARTSALLISMNGIGEEKRHIKFPEWFLSTPPIAEHDSSSFTDASTFHLIKFVTGGLHEIWFFWIMRPLIEDSSFLHNRHWGLWEMSEGEYGKLSPQPEIHHPSLSKIRSLRSFRDVDDSLKIRWFRSFQIVHVMMKKQAPHTFLKKGDFF